jgi:hypothetical protein
VTVRHVPGLGTAAVLLLAFAAAIIWRLLS